MNKMKQIREKLEKLYEHINDKAFWKRNYIREELIKILALIEAQEKEDKYMVKVKIPEPNWDGTCNLFCPALKTLINGLPDCVSRKGYKLKPIPGCLRYKEEEK
jgi:hypothetical protein